MDIRSLGDRTLRHPPRAGRTAEQLVTDVVDQPFGRVSLSLYETSRVVALAPHIAGHQERIRFLCAQQRPDGMWGGPGGYAVVPTLSVIDALLSTGTHSSVARTGLRATRIWLSRHGHEPLPDTVAAELIVAALTTAINSRLTKHEQLDGPYGDHKTLAALRQRVRSRGAIRDTLLHTLEVMPDLAPTLPSLDPVNGLVCASPAATAARLGDRDDPGFTTVLRLYGGIAPAFHPITQFERAWVITWLHGIYADLRQVPLPDSDGGASSAPGLPVDADTTAMTLWARVIQGYRPSLHSLQQFERADHFTTWLAGEADPSPTTNAHVLEALTAAGDADTWAEAASKKVRRWLLDAQRDDGTWTDKWHASPYYATYCCALALHRAGGTAALESLVAAARWILDTQRADGGWGLWRSTAEETAYAACLLTRTIPGFHHAHHSAATAIMLQADRALAAALEMLTDSRFLGERPAMWHDKDLYAPYNIIDAAVLAAITLLHDAARQSS